MIYSVFGGTLNLNQSVDQSIIVEAEFVEVEMLLHLDAEFTLMCSKWRLIWCSVNICILVRW